MKRIITLFMAGLLALPFAKADEGMWLPLLLQRLNYVDMQKQGLRLTAEEIYSINNNSLKDAIIQFGNGCTGEIISSKGLILTNHHCGYGEIQAHSTVEHDYLSNGFWAYKMADELPNPGLTAKFLIRIEDVTATMLSGINFKTNEKVRNDSLAARSKRLSAEAVKGTHYDSEVKEFFDGNEYYLFVYEIFRDVRLVGAPPSSVGKYGADTDNWMWPRHTGDFSIFRVYSGPDGKPAKYSKENIPLSPKHHLPINISGVQKGDFGMIMGYPGNTDRYLTSWGVNLAIDKVNPAIVKLRDAKLGIMRQYMDQDPAVRIQYASKYARTSNYWKYFIGQTKGLKRLDVAEKKAETENSFRTWVAANPERQDTYGEALPLIEGAYKQYGDYSLFRWYFIEAAARGPEVIGFSRGFSSLVRRLQDEKTTPEQLETTLKALRGMSDQFFKDYHAPIDQGILASMFGTYYTDMAPEYHPAFLTAAHAKYKGDWNKYAAMVFKKSIFVDKERVEALLAKPSAKAILQDPAYIAAEEFFNLYTTLTEKMTPVRTDLTRGNRMFVAGLREMNSKQNYYPNANSTMRLSYGTVQDYYPADAVHYNYFTTLDGVMEKEDSSNWEFVVPGKLKELYQKKDYGQYGENGVMKVCFTTNHDITGGNSGSPVINGKGELIGLAFDGNWEAMSGDIAFEPALQRTISVDIRYVLFIVDKFAGASNLIDEMTLVKTQRSEVKELTPAPENVKPVVAPTGM
jgi:hypothetical protein